mmetsp:Transcript_29590/g.33671  ORF Transcript_29590/g.33671 Transcript_29590/m.33671 type:complete len:306 (-) Transcript_29590:115-1032(-)
MKHVFLFVCLLALTISTAVQEQYASCTEWTADPGSTFAGTAAQTIQSAHNYCNNLEVYQHYSWTDSSVHALEIVFDSQTNVEQYSDMLFLRWTDSTGTAQSSTITGQNIASIYIDAAEFDLQFESDSSSVYWGYSFTATPSDPPCQDFINSNGATYTITSLTAQTIQSPHDYCSNLNVSQTYTFTNPSATSILITFDDATSLQSYADNLTFTYTSTTTHTPVTHTFSGRYFQPFTIDADTFTINLTTDASNNQYGYKFTATPSTEASTSAVVKRGVSAKAGASRLAALFKKWKKSIVEKSVKKSQ